MLKEIYEQPRAAADTLRGRVSPEGGTVVLPDIGLDPEIVAGLRRVVLVACGTSYHAALVGRFPVERLAGISAEVDLGSEYRYRDSVLGPRPSWSRFPSRGRRRTPWAPSRRPATRAPPSSASPTWSARPSPASPRACSTRTRAGDRGRLVQDLHGHAHRLLPPRSLARPAPRAIPAEDGRKHIQGLLELPRLLERVLESEPAIAELAARPRRLQELSLPRAGHPLPHGARGRPQAQGALVSARRGLPPRGR